MRIHDVVIKPLITEKALAHGQKNVYVFQVASDANKNQIKEAITTLFKVEVGTIKTLLKKGKVRRVGKRAKMKTMPDTKKAYVTVTKGTIDVVPQA